MIDDKEAARPLRVCFLTAGLYFDPVSTQNVARFSALSRRTEGDIFGVMYGAGSENTKIGRYTIRAISLPSWLGGYGTLRSLFRAAGYTLFVLLSAIKMRFSGSVPYQLIVSSDPFKSGLLALLCSRILGVPFAVELNGNYAAAMALQDGATHAGYMRLKARVAFAIMPFVLRRASGIKLLYETQMGEFGTPALMTKTRVFHNLVPLDPFSPKPADHPYFLLLGHPWLLKGADLAIRAFRQVCGEHPQFHLRIVGYCPNPKAFEELAANHPHIHLQPAGVPHGEAVELINRCFALILPSRTEGMGRVLLEAMAAAKPLIGSRVDGIPRIVMEGQNGLLFEPNNADDLAHKMARLMEDIDLARRMGDVALRDVQTRLSPDAYEDLYFEFICFASGSGPQ